MSSVKLTQPKKRRGPFTTTDPPFPIPTIRESGSLPSVDDWNFYTGALVDDHVLVQHTGDMDMLYRMGFYGKGNISRNRPEYNEGFWPMRKRKRDREPAEAPLRVITKRQYITHQQWKEQRLGRPGSVGDETDFHKIQQTHTRTKPFSHSSSEPLPCEQTNYGEPGDNVSPDRVDSTDTIPQQVVNDRVESAFSPDTDSLPTNMCPATRSGISDWPSPVREPEPEEEEQDPWAVDSKEDSANFWGMESSESSSWGKVKPFDNDSATESVTLGRIEEPKGCSDSPQHLCGGDKVSMKQSEGSAPSGLKHGNMSPATTDPATADNGNGTFDDQLENSNSEFKASDSSAEIPANDDGKVTDTKGTVCLLSQHQRNKDSGAAKPIIDPLCLEEQTEGNLCLMDDTDDECEENSEHQSGEVKKFWAPTRKKDPYPLHECLQLTFEEAFFLSFGLGCLVVVDETQEAMSLTKMWQVFSARRKDFVRKYIAYHSLRSRGWVPKAGIKYGVDFIAYYKGPAHYHGSYSVIVRMMNESERCEEDVSSLTMKWSSLMGADRVTETVAKEPLIMLVLRPSDMTDDDVASPKCIPRFKVQELLLKRWVPSKEREAAEIPEWL